MGSTRLPGKVLMPIQGKSILERAITRLKAAEELAEVAVLTTRLPEDDRVVAEALRLGAHVHRGPTLDVLTRFQEAAEKFHPEIIVRATADNPLIDIDSVTRIVRALRSGDLQWCMEEDLPYGAATEAISPGCLERLHRVAKEARDREHVTVYVKEHRDEFRTALLLPPESVCRPDLRLTVDLPEDFRFIRELIERVPENGSPVPLERYIRAARSLT
jgi:spore coat polysaccharide biosynthesis protein SpsF